jgi:hypothetical protein
MKPVSFVKYLLNGVERTASGRVAWALTELAKAGPDGCTPIDTPGPRWADYVYKLKKTGISVQTITEMHGGAFPGHHARYVLSSPVQILAVGEDA